MTSKGCLVIGKIDSRKIFYIYHNIFSERSQENRCKDLSGKNKRRKSLILLSLYSRAWPKKHLIRHSTLCYMRRLYLCLLYKCSVCVHLKDHSVNCQRPHWQNRWFTCLCLTGLCCVWTRKYFVQTRSLTLKLLKFWPELLVTFTLNFLKTFYLELFLLWPLIGENFTTKYLCWTNPFLVVCLLLLGTVEWYQRKQLWCIRLSCQFYFQGRPWRYSSRFWLVCEGDWNWYANQG